MTDRITENLRRAMWAIAEAAPAPRDLPAVPAERPVGGWSPVRVVAAAFVVTMVVIGSVVLLVDRGGDRGGIADKEAGVLVIADREYPIGDRVEAYEGGEVYESVPGPSPAFDTASLGPEIPLGQGPAVVVGGGPPDGPSILLGGVGPVSAFLYEGPPLDVVDDPRRFPCTRIGSSSVCGHPGVSWDLMSDQGEFVIWVEVPDGTAVVAFVGADGPLGWQTPRSGAVIVEGIPPMEVIAYDSEGRELARSQIPGEPEPSPSTTTDYMESSSIREMKDAGLPPFQWPWFDDAVPTPPDAIAAAAELQAAIRSIPELAGFKVMSGEEPYVEAHYQGAWLKVDETQMMRIDIQRFPEGASLVREPWWEIPQSIPGGEATYYANLGNTFTRQVIGDWSINVDLQRFVEGDTFVFSASELIDIGSAIIHAMDNGQD